ncbi:MAG: MBL fold metallo-hydrolase [Deltaproteobacteria bacterium]|nr:MBL fold metallo-hydrolase [Deltaproteobacteria bacterium]
MTSDKRYADVRGILVIFAESHLWPNPANIFVIPDDRGFSMVDVGGRGELGYRHLMSGLRHLGLKLPDLHTVLLSHAHPDHMGAIPYILEEVHPRVLIHSLDVESALNPVHLHYTFDIPLAKEKYASSGEHQDFDLLHFFDEFGCLMSAAEDVEEMHEGDVIGLGNFEFEVILTPGHAPGHISLFEKRTGILLAGDLVGNSPAWYTPSSGGLTGYLASLDKLEAKNASLLIPSHGTILDNPSQGIDRIRGKLLKREAILMEALKDGPKSFMELNAALFRHEIIHFFPGCGIIESHLVKLEQDGMIDRNGDVIRLKS